MTRRVNSVSKKHHSLSTWDGLELFSQNVCNCVIKARASTGACTTNGLCDHVPIRCRFAQDVNSVIKRHYHHAVGRFQLVDEIDRGALDVIETKPGRTARIDH